jgi:hypothetical protein
MRIGSLEMLAAFSAFAVIAARLKPAAFAPERAVRSVHVGFRVREAAGSEADRDVALTITAGQPVVLGRSSQADVALADPEVSRRHAQLDLDRGVLYLADCGSSNGTFLNGKRVDTDGIEVRPGDDIDVGNTRITITRTEPLTWK